MAATRMTRPISAILIHIDLFMVIYIRHYINVLMM